VTLAFDEGLFCRIVCRRLRKRGVVRYRSACVACVTAFVVGAALGAPQPLRAAAPAAAQKTESKLPSQTDVEAQLLRMLNELKRENARRGLTEIPTPPSPLVTSTLPPAAVTPAAAQPALPAPTAAAPAPPTDVIPAPPGATSAPEPPSSVVLTAPRTEVPAVVPSRPPSVVPPPAPLATPVISSGGRLPLPAVEGFIAADVQAFLGVPGTIQQGPRGTVVWHYLTPNGRQFVYFVDGVATVTAPADTRPVAPARQTPGRQGECQGLTAATGFKNLAVINADSPVFIEPKFRTQPLTLLPAKKTAEVSSADGAWYLIRFNDERWGRRVGYIHCSDVVRQDQ